MTGNTEKYSENKMDDKVDAGLKRPGKDQGKNPMKALGRLLRYVLKEYKLACVTVVVRHTYISTCNTEYIDVHAETYRCIY